MHGKNLERWRCGDLPVITESLKFAAKQGLEFVEDRLTPAGQEWIKGSIVTLMTHYYVANLPEHVHSAIASDWLEDLGGFPAWAISEARKEWRQNNKRKPTPGDMFELCQKATSKENAMMLQCNLIVAASLTPAPKPELTEEQIEARNAEISEIVAKAKKNLSMGGV